MKIRSGSIWSWGLTSFLLFFIAINPARTASKLAQVIAWILTSAALVLFMTLPG